MLRSSWNSKFGWDAQYPRIYGLGTSQRNEREGDCVLISFSLFGSSSLFFTSFSITSYEHGHTRKFIDNAYNKWHKNADL
jgi:hypothetical protein